MAQRRVWFPVVEGNGNTRKKRVSSMLFVIGNLLIWRKTTDDKTSSDNASRKVRHKGQWWFSIGIMLICLFVFSLLLSSSASNLYELSESLVVLYWYILHVVVFLKLQEWDICHRKYLGRSGFFGLRTVMPTRDIGRVNIDRSRDHPYVRIITWNLVFLYNRYL